MSVDKLKSEWVDTPEFHLKIKNEFDAIVNADESLKELRDWVEQNAFGFGERCFYHMWDLIIQEAPKNFKLLEIGVFRGQTLALVRLLSNRHDKNADIIGVSPLDSSDGHWESDYEKDVKHIHDKFTLSQPYIVKGLSTDVEIIKKAGNEKYDIVYIDGGHEYEVVSSDLRHYPNMVKVNGLLVIDDACCEMSQPWGFFQGIEAVTKATLEWFEANNENWEFVFNVVHLRIYRRIK